MKRIPSAAAVFVIRSYQVLISPFLGDNCRFHPSCSSYALESIKRFGAFRGTVLAFMRIIKCGPWHSGGFDPVPGEFPPIADMIFNRRTYSPKGR